MENKDIIKTIRLIALLMELHEENPFKIRGFQNAVFKLEKANDSLKNYSLEQLTAFEDLGKSMAGKINNLITAGTFPELNELMEKTPVGVVEILNIKGLGPKKVKTLWKELNICSKEELLAACNENKIADLKGFGLKTQDQIKQSLVFLSEQKGKFLYAEIEKLAYQIEEDIKNSGHAIKASIAGDVRRKAEIVECIQIITACTKPALLHQYLDKQDYLQKEAAESGPFVWRGKHLSGAKLEVKMYDPTEFGGKLYLHSASRNHLLQETVNGKNFYTIIAENKFPTEEDVFSFLQLPSIAPECREGFDEISLCREGKFPILVNYQDLKGILHNHSTYSDGQNTLEEMALYCKNLGFEYLGISDHSKSAFYAGGLTEDKVFSQFKEIDELNKKLAPFKIFKGIESDILNDGSLDYDDEVLSKFDFIVASVHSNLRMSEEKATQRLITAIENPYTTMLGHATGRLLLMREGYPIDHKKVIDACAANNVVIEINANPRRLDMDWKWIKYAIGKNIMISINPDAHSVEGYHDMQYGLHMARKACLTKELTFNALPLREIENFFVQRKKAVGVI